MCPLTEHLVKLISEPMLDHIEHWPGIEYYLLEDRERAFVMKDKSVMSLMTLADDASLPLALKDRAVQTVAMTAALFLVIEDERMERKKALRHDLNVVHLQKYVVSAKQWVTGDNDEELNR